MRSWIASVAVAAVLAMAGTAVGQGNDDLVKQAGQHFARAEAAEQSGDWQTAYDEYEQAYKLSPHPDVLYNMASVSERLGKLRRAAELYRRYLDESDPRPADAPKVERIIVSLEKRIAEQEPESNPIESNPIESNPIEPDPQPNPQSQSTNPYSTPTPRVDTGVGVKVEPPASNYAWRVGGSYGFGWGDVPVERWQIVASYMAVKWHLQAEFAAGLMGRNDIGIGAGGRYWIDRGFFRPFLRVLGTVGYAKKDAASDSGQAFPLSVEAGVGLSWSGPNGELYAVAGPRLSFGGVSEDDTLSDAHINDSLAITIDFGLAFGTTDHTARSLTAKLR